MSAEFVGKRVLFCSADCKAEFENDPIAEQGREAAGLVRGVAYRERIELARGLEITFTRAGHILAMSRPQRRTGVWLNLTIKWRRKRSKPAWSI